MRRGGFLFVCFFVVVGFLLGVFCFCFWYHQQLEEFTTTCKVEVYVSHLI